MTDVYWEKQASDLLCGLHCLNSLAQAPIFDEIMLAEIGVELDKQEQELLGGQKVYTNVNESGNFSLQVLIKALDRIGDFTLSSIKSEANKDKDLR